MSPTLSTAVALLLAFTVTVIATVDAALSDQWDTVAMLVLLALLHLGLLARVRGRRPAVPVRSDLVRWLRMRSAVSGESVEVLVDRALATYREQYGDGRAEAEAAVGR